MPKKVYLLILHCIDNWGKEYDSYDVYTTREKAENGRKESLRLSTEIVDSEIKEAYLYD